MQVREITPDVFVAVIFGQLGPIGAGLGPYTRRRRKSTATPPIELVIKCTSRCFLQTCIVRFVRFAYCTAPVVVPVGYSYDY